LRGGPARPRLGADRSAGRPSGSEGVPSGRGRVVRSPLPRGAHATPGRGVAADPLGPGHPDRRSDGLRQDPGRVPGGHRLALSVRRRGHRRRIHGQRRLRLPPQGSCRRHRREPAAPAGGDRRHRPGDGLVASGPASRGPYRGHLGLAALPPRSTTTSWPRLSPSSSSTAGGSSSATWRCGTPCGCPGGTCSGRCAGWRTAA